MVFNAEVRTPLHDALPLAHESRNLRHCGQTRVLCRRRFTPVAAEGRQRPTRMPRKWQCARIAGRREGAAGALGRLALDIKMTIRSLTHCHSLARSPAKVALRHDRGAPLAPSLPPALTHSLTPPRKWPCVRIAGHREVALGRLEGAACWGGRPKIKMTLRRSKI